MQWCEVEPLDNNKPTFTDNLLSICSQRKDDWSEVVNVRLHLQAVVTTLPAYDGRYHNDCYQSFRKIPKQNQKKDQSHDDPLTHVIKYMESHKQTTWTVSELYEVYVQSSGSLSSRTMVQHLSYHYRNELITLNILGCKTEMGFREDVCKTFKMIKKSQSDDDSDVSNIVKIIKAEVDSIPSPQDYYLSDIRYEKTVPDIRQDTIESNI